MAIQLLPRRYTLLAVSVLVLGLQACSLGTPVGIKPVSNFDIHQYLGKWHEIARLDHRFERGLEQVIATYTLQENGEVCVENAGWNSRKGKKKKAIGKAKLVSGPQIGHLKVSFFGPFYGSYVVFHLEPDYSVAMVCGNSRDYCWILARKPILDREELARYVDIAKKHGFVVDKLIYPSPAEPVASQTSH